MAFSYPKLLMCISKPAFSKSGLILHHQVTGHGHAVLESYVKFVITAASALNIEMAK